MGLPVIDELGLPFVLRAEVPPHSEGLTLSYSIGQDFLPCLQGERPSGVGFFLSKSGHLNTTGTREERYLSVP